MSTHNAIAEYLHGFFVKAYPSLKFTIVYPDNNDPPKYPYIDSDNNIVAGFSTRYNSWMVMNQANFGHSPIDLSDEEEIIRRIKESGL